MVILIQASIKHTYFELNVHLYKYDDMEVERRILISLASLVVSITPTESYDYYRFLFFKGWY